MKKLHKDLNSSLYETIKKLGLGIEAKIHLESPSDKSYGDYSTNIAMQLAGKAGKNPRELAESIVKELDEIEYVDKVEVAGPGFINFWISESYYVKLFKELIDKTNIFQSERKKQKRIMVEFAHPNPFKQIHVGHLRNIILGEAIVRTLESQSAEVIRTNYQGDVGMHIAKCLWAFKKVKPEDFPKDLDARVELIGRMYSKGATAYKENEKAKKEIRDINKKIYSQEDQEINKLWELGKRWSFDKFQELCARLDSHFDRQYMESEVIAEGLKNSKQALEKGILEESEGAVIFNGNDYGLDTRVFINSEGLPTYEGKELGLAPKEFTDFGELDLCIHNVAVEQKSFFEVTFKVQKLLWPKLIDDKQYHNAYEFVGLRKGKMSSRLGNIVTAEAVLDEAKKRIRLRLEESDEILKKEIDMISEKLAIAAVKFSFLKISAFKYLAFDIDESVKFEGFSGPYIVYTHVRANSIIEKLIDYKLKDFNWSEIKLESSELELMKKLIIASDIVQSCADQYSMHHLCLYLYELAKLFSIFYENNSVLNAEDENTKKFRIILTRNVAKVIKQGLDILGIGVVDKM